MKSQKVFHWLSVVALVIASMGSAAAPSQAAWPASGPVVDSAADPTSALIQGTPVSSAQMPPELDAPPAQADAVVTDPNNPLWQVHYGTQAGRQLIPPRSAPMELRTNGPTLPISGTWQVQGLQLGANTITAIADAPDGRLFVGVSNDGLRIYAPDTFGAYGWTVVHASGNGLASDKVTSLALFNNEMWVGTSDAGISALDLTTGTWRQINMGLYPLPSNTINRMTVGFSLAFFSSYIWIATNAGAVKYDGSSTWTLFSTSNGLPSNNVLDVAIQNVFVGFNLYQYTWFATATSGGLAVWTGSAWGSTGAGGPSCPLSYARRIVVDNSDAVWVTARFLSPNSPSSPSAPAGDDGIGVCRRDSSGTWTQYNATTPGLPSNEVTDLGVDSAGRVWMSTLGGGVSYDQGAWGFYTTANSGIASNYVNQVWPVGEAIWFGHYLAPTLSQYSPNWLRFLPQDVFSRDDPSALYLEATTAWVGLGPGVAWRDATTWHYQLIPSNTLTVTSFTRDGAGTLWIGTAGNGVFTFDGSNFSHQTTADGLPSNNVRALLTDSDGHLWVATNGGLALRGNGYWLAFTAANSPLLSNDLRTLTLDKTDRIWIGTGASGISILNPKATGSGMWSTQVISTTSAWNTINSLAADPSGNVWAATPSGVGQWISGTWTLHTVASYALPDDNALSVASDPMGRVWAGTAGGLSFRYADAWQTVFHVTGSTLGADHATALQSDGMLWAVAGSAVAMRGVITSPIGAFPPTISTFNPTSGPPGTVVTINGTHFDTRGPQFNRVWIGTQNGSGGAEAEVLSVGSTSLLVRVPFLAHTGKIFITANGLNVESTSDFTVVPDISYFTPTCLGLGQKVTIWGGGWAGPELVWVKIGNGGWRQADYSDPGKIVQITRPGDTDGAISVRVGTSGPVVASSQSIGIGAPQVAGVAIQQGVQGEQMIWTKRTLVQAVLNTTGGSCNAHVDGGQLEWKWKGGSTSPGPKAYFTKGGGLDVTNTAPQVSMNTAVNFVMEPSVGYNLSDFDGVRITLKSGPVTLLTYDVPASSFGFLDTASKNHVLIVPVLPPGYTNAQYANFLKTEYAALRDVARAYPQQDDAPWYTQYGWMTQAIDFFQESSVNLNTDDFDRVRGEVDNIRSMINDQSNGGLDQAVALVAQELYMGGPSGKAMRWCWPGCSQNTSVVFNFDFNPPTRTLGMAPIFLQETTHSLNWVQPGSPNHASYNEGHSRYDEGQWSDEKYCKANQTFRQALIDYYGQPRRVVQLERWQAPYEYPLTGCDWWTMPRSAMSYAPYQTNQDSFLEPLDYNYVLSQIQQQSQLAAAAQPALITAPYTRTFRLSGEIDAADRVTTTLAYVAADLGNITPDDPGGFYHVQLRDAGNAVLVDQSFNINFENTHGDNSSVSPFSMRIPFPAATVKAEVRHGAVLLWSKTVSAHAPTVNFISPSGGTYSADATIPITWTASDVDDGPLQYALQYSPDDGATWLVLNPYLTATSFNWQPGYVPISTTAKLRVTASDGYNTATATSVSFTLTPRAPTALIVAPKNGQAFLEGEVITLDGGSVSNYDVDSGTLTWLHNGALLGTGQLLTYTLDQVGTHVFTLQVGDHGFIGTDSVTVTVRPDFDRDGMPDDWELTHGLNPLDPTDATLDSDGDGLTNLREFQLGTDPQKADTDGDGFSDGAEVAAGTNPLRADSKPALTPVLNVGSADLEYSVVVGAPSPTPVSFFVSNGGTGSLAWTASQDAPWLGVTPASGSGTAPVTLTLSTQSLPLGHYTGRAVWTAPGAADSPYTVTVTLDVVRADGMKVVYLPIVIR